MNPIVTSRPVLITGGCGFIGSNIADALARTGRSVVVLDDFGRHGSRENAAWLTGRHGTAISVVEGDVGDAALVGSIVPTVGAVLHLAAQVAVTTSLLDPLRDHDVNVHATLLLLEAVRKQARDIPFLYASTNKVYGDVVPSSALSRLHSRYVPSTTRFENGVDETAALDFHSPYGCSKGAADQYVRDYARMFGLATVVLRMSCVYGSRQFGNEDQGWVAHLVASALRGDAVTVFGDGFQVRDVLFVDDAVRAWLDVLTHAERLAGSVFNLGGGLANSVSLLEMIDRIGEDLGRPPRVRFADWRPGDQRWYVSDVSALTAATGWRPATPLAAGLVQLRRWLIARSGMPAHRPARVPA